MIAVLGLGFVGLTTALGFAEKGFAVTGFDLSAERSAALAGGKVPFFEPVLEEKLRAHTGKHFRLAKDLNEALSHAQIVFLCVGTPTGDDGRADLRPLLSAMDSVVQASKGTFRTLVIKSTVPPGTLDKELRGALQKAGVKVGVDLGLASNPEFLREGHAWDDFITPDRIVLGVEDEKSKAALEKIYSPFGVSLRFVSPSTAEFIKYLSNTLLSTLISFSNEMAMLGDKIGNIDIKAAFKVLHEDKRWSGAPANMATYAWPGAGFGGYCLPKDTAALAARAREFGLTPHMLQGAITTNAEVKNFVVEKIAASTPKDAVIGILGLSFKPGSDDVRDAPSAAAIRGLIKKGYSNIHVFDPMANAEFARAYPDLKIIYEKNLADLLAKSTRLVLLTAWPEFKNLPTEAKAKLLDFRYT